MRRRWTIVATDHISAHAGSVEAEGGEVEMGGTIRSLTRPGYRFMDERVQAVLTGAAAVGSCQLNLTLSSLEYDCLSRPAPEGAPGSCTFPPTINEASAYRLAKGAAIGLIGQHRYHDAAPTMGGEDFAYLLEKVPGAIVFLGIGNKTLGTDVNLHNPRFQMDEGQMPLGAALHVEMALRSLATPVGTARPCKESSTTGDAANQAVCSEGTNIEGED